MIDLLLLIGGLSIFLSSVGLLRMPDTLSKLHAATKASACGITCFAIATALRNPTVETVFLCISIVVILYITAPLACHAISSRELNKPQSKSKKKD